MSNTANNRSLKIIVILLMLVNAIVLFFHIRLLTAQTGARPPRPDDLKNRMIHDLSLNPEQQDAYGEMVERHRAAMQQIRYSEEETRGRLYQEPGDTTIDRATYFNELGQLRAEREKVTFDHFMELRTILDDIQKTIFDRIIGEAVNGMEPRPPRK